MKNYTLNFFEKWMLKRIAKKAVLQSFDHQKNMECYYQTIVDVARQEFTEDNKPTLDGILEDCHAKALNSEIKTEKGRIELCTN